MGNNKRYFTSSGFRYIKIIQQFQKNDLFPRIVDEMGIIIENVMYEMINIELIIEIAF